MAIDHFMRSVAERRGRKQLAAGQEMEMLRQRLAATQEDLHSIIEEQEASNEELQSANEEILSSNEELQSTNEELETAKEELQATNEELTTVNEELQNRNAELTGINNDLINLIASVDIVIIMLSQDLRIRRFTPSAQRVMNLIAGDIGRPLRDINTRLRHPGIERMIAEVIDTMTVKEQDVQDADGRWYSMRVRPYRTVDNKIDGAVLALVEIDELKRLAQRLQLLSRVFQAGSDPIIVQDMAGKIIDLNDECVKAYGWTREELLGKPANTLVPPGQQARARALLERCMRLEEVRNVEGVLWTKDRKRLPASISVTLIAGEEGEPAAMATIARHPGRPETT
jgi:two-component system CheB/CheR fusion protein